MPSVLFAADHPSPPACLHSFLLSQSRSLYSSAATPSKPAPTTPAKLSAPEDGAAALALVAAADALEATLLAASLALLAAELALSLAEDAAPEADDDALPAAEPVAELEPVLLEPEAVEAQVAEDGCGDGVLVESMEPVTGEDGGAGRRHTRSLTPAGLQMFLA